MNILRVVAHGVADVYLAGAVVTGTTFAACGVAVVAYDIRYERGIRDWKARDAWTGAMASFWAGAAWPLTWTLAVSAVSLYREVCQYGFDEVIADFVQSGENWQNVRVIEQDPKTGRWYVINRSDGTIEQDGIPIGTREDNRLAEWSPVRIKTKLRHSVAERD